MPRGKSLELLSLPDLQSFIRRQSARLAKLKREHGKLTTRLKQVEREMSVIAGNGAAGGGRARNAKSLVATLEEVLARSGKPMQVGDILEKVKATGYRSGSANFRAIINQTLIKEKQFQQVERGTYTLKK
jgi:hypothetical protein